MLQFGAALVVTSIPFFVNGMDSLSRNRDPLRGRNARRYALQGLRPWPCGGAAVEAGWRIKRRSAGPALVRDPCASARGRPYSTSSCAGCGNGLKKVRPRISPRPDLTGARGTSARAAISFYIVTTIAAVLYDAHSGLAVVNDQFFLGEKLERAVPFHVNGVSEVVVNCWKNGDDRAALVVVGCIIDLLANCKLRHRELLQELSKLKRLSPPIR